MKLRKHTTPKAEKPEVIQGHVAHYIDYKSKKYHYITLGVSISSFAIIGSILVFGSNASVRHFVAIESENATKIGTISSVVAADASGGSSLRFDASPKMAPPPTTSTVGNATCPKYPAFPNASCTGVPAGYATSQVNGTVTTTANGQVIDGKVITGDLLVSHANVTVTNTRIMGRIINVASSNLVISNSDIGPDTCPSGPSNYNSIDGSNYTLLRTHIHNNAADLVRVGATGTVLIEDSILDRTCFYTGDHFDAVQLYAPGSLAKVTIIHSSIDVRPVNVAGAYGNAAVFWAEKPGSGSRLTITQSLLAGGAYTTALYDATATSNVIIDVNNSVYIRNSSQYGPCSSSNSVPFNGTSGVTFTGNTYNDGSAIKGC